MKQLIFFVLLAFTSETVTSQFSVEGKITDTTGVAIPYTTVVISTQKDSTMVGYAITGVDGWFVIEKVATGDYFIQASFMGYANLRKPVKVSGDLNLGTLVLKEKRNELNEVVVEEDAIPVLFKKDTVEYNAGSFKTKKNADVEGLLKRLPGMEVDEDGNVKAHGETVTKVLVDGKEFFGDDPKIATKNIPADAIDKVQVFDKKSEMSEFTGVDDGVRTRTINLKLKEDRKKGYFGDIMGGYGYEDRYKAKLNLNRFSQTAQFTSLVMANNVNEQGFSYQDYFNFMGGISNVLKTGKMSFDPSETGMPINIPGLNNGVANTLAGGINYNQDFGVGTHIISSFFVNNANTDLLRYTNTTNFTDDGNFISESSEDQNQKLENYRLNFKLEHEFNSNNLLEFKTTGILSNNVNVGESTEINSFTSTQNTSKNIFKDNGFGANGTADLNFRTRLKKEGRSINFQGSFYILNNDDNRLTDIVNTLNFDSLPLNQSLSQLQDQLNDKKQYLGTITFTEPVSKRIYLITEWTSFFQTEQNSKDFFDLIAGAEVKNDFLSNAFTSNFQYHQLGSKVNYKYKKNLFVLGLDAQASRLIGTTDAEIAGINRSFQTLLPNFYWKNQASMSNRKELRYTTTFSEPSVSQLQPVINNANPLNIYEGNPNLMPEYRHVLSFNYFKYDAFNFSSFSFNVSGNATNNQIVNAQYIDSVSGLRRSTPINVKNNFGGNTSLGYSFRIKPIKTLVRVRANGGFSSGINFVNDIENDYQTVDYGYRISIGNVKKNIVDFQAGINMNFNENRFSLNKEANTRYINTKLFAEIDIEFKKGWDIGAEANQNFYEGSLYNDNPSFLILNAYVSKIITKNKRGTLKLFVSDILNQRNGINFYGQQNYFVESQVNVLRRYYMLTFNYKIIKI